MKTASGLPHLRVPRAPESWDRQASLETWDWERVPTLPPFTLADGSGPAAQQTAARLCYDRHALYLRFDCDDRDIWGTYSQRDDPIYEEEVVELFISPGAETPTHYYEIEISPCGVLFDALIANPTSLRADLKLDTSLNPPLRWQAGIDEAAKRWWAVLVVPWTAIAPAGELPKIWRANFFRIERPRDGAPEFSCWSPTLTEPADFHKPAYFGTLSLD